MGVKLIKPMSVGGKFGFVDSNHVLSVKPVFKYAEDFSDGYALVIKLKYNERENVVDWIFGFIDETGNVIYKLGYESIKGFSDGMASFKRNDKYGFMDTSLTEVIEPKFDKVGKFHNGFATFRMKKGKEDKVGYINKKGEIVIPAIYDRAEPFSEGVAVVENDGISKIIDENNNVLFETEMYLRGFSTDGIISAFKFKNEECTKYGFVNKYGETVIDFKYNMAGMFFDGLAPVSDENDKCGYINTKGEVVIDFKYDSASLFKEGRAKVAMKFIRESNIYKDGVPYYQYAYIDTTGKELTGFEYEYLNEFKNGYGTVMSDFGDNRLIDKNGNVIDVIIPK